MSELIGGAAWIELSHFSDDRGALTPVESGRDLPFSFKRVFYFYDVPVSENRGSHAHREQHQLLVCVAGAFSVVIDTGSEQQTVRVSRPWIGLHVPPMLWTSQVDFDGGTIGLVFASDFFDEADYIRDYEEYRALTQK